MTIKEAAMPSAQEIVSPYYPRRVIIKDDLSEEEAVRLECKMKSFLQTGDDPIAIEFCAKSMSENIALQLLNILGMMKKNGARIHAVITIEPEGCIKRLADCCVRHP